MPQLTRITRDPSVMGGKPCIRGMRVTVGTVVGLVAAGRTREEILREYPYRKPRTSRRRCPTPPGARRKSKFPGSLCQNRPFNCWWSGIGTRGKQNPMIWCFRPGQENRFLPTTSTGGWVFSACVKLELPRATWLTLRRTYSSWAHAMGVPGKVVASLMGHAKVDTTLNVLAPRAGLGTAGAEHREATRFHDGQVEDANFAACEIGSPHWTISATVAMGLRPVKNDENRRAPQYGRERRDRTNQWSC
jgi:hypothetical protein